MLEQIRSRYETYIQKIANVREKTPIFAGFLGFGNDPRDNPCNEEFYEDVDAMIDEYIKTAPDAHAAEEIVRWMLAAPQGYEQHLCYWYLFAAQGICRKLVPFLTPADSAAIAQWYNGLFPKKKRFPAQEELYKALVRRGRK